MAFTFDNEVYLFGAFYKGEEIGDEIQFPDWHTQPDLIRVTELTGKIRPIFWWHTVTQIRSNMA
ncbi:hypothetical protein D0856_25715 [Vibrio owensii]|uniref:hypothetical protein n=1 Tax=Vibrio owensii TaxID=696485 RepID=UPI000EFC5F77|nr:hypothetical protein [Vibrio owensii]AYO23264.1 hypothetical protein D0856_25715 [Vibrio owensii]